MLKTCAIHAIRHLWGKHYQCVNCNREFIGEAPY